MRGELLPPKLSDASWRKVVEKGCRGAFEMVPGGRRIKFVETEFDFQDMPLEVVAEFDASCELESE